jgi:hypothetical protein
MRTEELIAELEKALRAAESPDGYFTAHELACAWFSCLVPNSGEVRRVREALRALQAVGRVDCTRVRRERMDGVVSTVPAYRVRAA